MPRSELKANNLRISALLTMTQPDDCTPAPDHLRTALEASCGALIMLEWIRRETAAAEIDADSLQARLTDTIESLHRATAELRLARDDEPSVLAFGFVLRPAPARSRAGSRRSGHPSPRRTA